MQIVILGMHRSGTSATTRLVNMMGAYFAPEGLSLGFSPDNPKGFWERKDVLEINQLLLRHFGCSWYKVDGWDDQALDSLPPALVARIQNLVLEMDAHRPWVMKDPRLCITLPAWLAHLEVPVAVVAARDPLEIARSLEMRNGMPADYALALWEYHAVGIIRRTASLPKLFVRYERLVEDPVNETSRWYDGLGALGVRGLSQPSAHEIQAFITPSLRRARAAEEGAKLTPHQRRLATMLQGSETFDPELQVSPESRQLMAAMGKQVSGAPKAS